MAAPGYYFYEIKTRRPCFRNEFKRAIKRWKGFGINYNPMCISNEDVDAFSEAFITFDKNTTHEWVGVYRN
jgi:hypothetical protein